MSQIGRGMSPVERLSEREGMNRPVFLPSSSPALPVGPEQPCPITNSGAAAPPAMRCGMDVGCSGKGSL